MIKRQTVILFVASFWVVFTVAGCGEPEPVLIDCGEHLSGSTTTAIIGRTERGKFYKLGMVLVVYEHVTEGEEADNIITAPVKKFFTQRGYTPKVMGILLPNQVIYIGEDVDPAPMLKDLERVKGVEHSGLYPLYRLSDLMITRIHELPESGPDFAPYGDLFGRLYDKYHKEETTPRELIEVGTANDGSLYEFGSVLVLYHNRIFPRSDPDLRAAAPKTVYDFFVSKGYEPKIENRHARLEVLRVGECVDTAPMLEELRAIPGVAEVHLNTFSLSQPPAFYKLLDRR